MCSSASCEVTAQLIASPDMLDRIVRYEAIEGKGRRRSNVPKTEKAPLLVLGVDAMRNALVGKRAPNFSLMCTDGSPSGRRQVSLDDFLDRWLMLLFYPRDFSLI